jgi:trehalose 6-phosphate phosphatase
MTKPAPLDELPLDQARDWALFLDFDGTLVEIAPQPDAVRVPPRLPVLLGELAEGLGGALALVSGRPIAELDGFLAPARPAVGGQHGLERRDGGGALVEAEIDRAALAGIAAELDRFAGLHPGTRVERKSMSTALHYRNAPAAEAAARDLVGRLAARHAEGFHVQGGKMVLEIKPRGADKGTVIGDFLDLPPFAGRRPVFVGDDLTDEHGFRVVKDRGGIAIQVGTREPTLADRRIADPPALLAWLETVARRVRAERS